MSIYVKFYNSVNAPFILNVVIGVFNPISSFIYLFLKNIFIYFFIISPP